mgnify:CR=1 FL=1
MDIKKMKNFLEEQGFGYNTMFKKYILMSNG